MEINITEEDYQKLLIEKKQIRDKLFNIKLEIFKNKKNDKKLEELNLEVKRIRHSYANVLLRIKLYEEQQFEKGMKL